MLTEQLVTLAEAARILGCHTATVRRWANEGHNGRTLDVVRIGRLVRTSVEALERFSCSPISPRFSRPDEDYLSFVRQHGNRTHKGVPGKDPA